MNLFACRSLITLRFNEGGRSERHKSVMTRSPICRLLLAMIESFTSNLSALWCVPPQYDELQLFMPAFTASTFALLGFSSRFSPRIRTVFSVHIRPSGEPASQFASHHSLARPSLECPHHSTTICDGDVIEPRSARSLEWSRVFVYINCTFSLLLSIVFCGIDIWSTLAHSLVRSVGGSCVRRCLFVKVNT